MSHVRTRPGRAGGAAGELDSGEIDVPGNPWGMRAITDRLAARTPADALS